MKKQNLLLVLGVITGLTGCNSGSPVTVTTPSCTYPTFTQQLGQTLLTNWGNGLQQYYNPTNIYESSGFFTMSYYYLDATLQPTVSAEQRLGIQSIYDYFTTFLANNTVMSLPNPESNIAYSLGCGYGSYIGYYNFTTYSETAEESIVQARFAITYEYEPTPFISTFTVIGGPTIGTQYSQTNPAGWYILSQSSSTLP
jgi:hypothetical protein